MTVRENYSLCQTLEKGVAYHHGKLPMHVRRTLEKAIADKKINTDVKELKEIVENIKD